MKGSVKSNMKIKKSFASGRLPGRGPAAERRSPSGETTVSRQAQESISGRPEAMLKNHAVDFSTLSERPEWLTIGGTILECAEFSTVSTPAPTSIGPRAHSRRSNPMDNSDFSAFSRGEKGRIMLSHSVTEIEI